MPLLSIPGQCIQGTVSRVLYSDPIVNHTIVGPLLSSLTALNDSECKNACFFSVPDVCYMFNYYNLTGQCELFYNGRVSLYQVEKKKGWTFRTRKCSTNPCLNEGQCYSLGDKNHSSCICKPGYNGTVCQTPVPTTIVPKEYSRPMVNHSIVGPVLSLSFVADEQSCQVKCDGTAMCCMFNFYPWTTKLCYPLDMTWNRMGYTIAGYNYLSSELLLPEISPPIAVTKGKVFRIWFGPDLADSTEFDNSGTTCADVLAYYTE
ncbi:hypothetical protein QZH41_004514 [Actinostola sp. cb2023]|nr:hypothetical protein QZH41_004514 [Actinostola sp. cb2023]